MAGFRFLHCADIHLDSPLRGLSAYAGAPAGNMRAATRRALDNLTQLAIEERVDFVVIAGDLYDDDWKDFQTGLYFTAQMARLGRAGIRVYVVRGNHDAASLITRSLPDQKNVTVLSAKRPQSVPVDGLDAVVHGQSFATRAVNEDLAAAYPGPVAGAFNIGLLHTSLSGRPPHEPYAPCRLERLLNHGYQYWALGHAHTREVVHDQGPHVVFPGNLQGRNIRETGAKGATLVTVRDGAVTQIEHRSVDVLRWAVASADVGSCADRGQVLSRMRQELEQSLDQAEGRLLAVRVRMTGTSPAHGELVSDRETLRDEVRAVAADVSDHLWIEKVEAQTRASIDRAALRARDDAIGEVLATLDSMAGDPGVARALLAEVTPLFDKLPADLRAGLPDFGDDAVLGAALAEVEDMLLATLADTGDAP